MSEQFKNRRKEHHYILKFVRTLGLMTAAAIFAGCNVVWCSYQTGSDPRSEPFVQYQTDICSPFAISSNGTGHLTDSGPVFGPVQ